MSMMKRYLEQLSVDMGFGGELNDEVFQAGERKMYRELEAGKELVEETEMEEIVACTCVGCGATFCADKEQDLCKGCASIACEAGCESYREYLNEPNTPFYVDATGVATPFPTEPPSENEAE